MMPHAHYVHAAVARRGDGRPSRLGSATLALALALIGAAPAVRAQSTSIERAKASFKAGAAAYELGDYLAAIQALEAAYDLTPLPAIAFSLAQAERRQYFISREVRHLTRAIELFRRYLREVPSAGRRADAIEALGQLEPLAPQIDSEPRLANATAQAPASQTRLMISCDPRHAQVALDGAAPVAAPLIAQVEPGPHKLEVHAAGYFPYMREVEAIAGALVPIDVALRERPALVTVSSKPEASLHVDGSFVATVAEPRQLTLGSGPHVLSFARNGHHVESFDLRLSPGATPRVDAMLRPTTQRTAALVLFGVGGASLLGGAVFAGLSLSREGDAQALLERRSQQSLSGDELREYSGGRRDRDRLRIIATAGFVSGVACLLTGLLLYALDPPQAAER